MFQVKQIIAATGGKLLSGDLQLTLTGVSIDSRTIKRGELYIAIKGARFDGHAFIAEAVKRGARAVVIAVRQRTKASKQQITCIKVSDTRRALGQIAKLYRQKFSLPVIAVTGSNGKTTTKEMIAHILSGHKNVLKNLGTQNNDIGVPLNLLKLNSSHDAAVLELGTNHFGEIDYLADIAKPNLGVITNIGPAHLENLINLGGVYREKKSLLLHLQAPRIKILNADDVWLKKLSILKKNFIFTYGINNNADFRAGNIKLTSIKAIEFDLISSKANIRHKVTLSTLGAVNIYNALAAISVARILGISYKAIARSLKNFRFPEGRLVAKSINGISFIDDTYNANPASLSEAISVLDRLRVRGKKIFVMGDMMELGKSRQALHRQAGVEAAAACDILIGVGSLARLAARSAARSGLNKSCILTCDNSRQARNLLVNTVKPTSRDLILVKGSRIMKMEEVFK